MTIYTPRGQAFKPYMDALTQPHLLIAGATGSGKSVLVNGLIHTALFKSYEKAQFILIDPKRVELAQYKQLQHTIRYASEPNEMLAALRYAMDLCEKRYKVMQKKGLRKSTESDVYMVIDEFADLMTTQKKDVKPLIQRLAQIGRAANIHIWLCTQTPIASVIPTEIKCNFDSRFGLRTRSAQDSRNILGCTGLERLPQFGQAYYMTPNGTQHIAVPYFTDTELAERIQWWTQQKTWLGRRKAKRECV